MSLVESTKRRNSCRGMSGIESTKLIWQIGEHLLRFSIKVTDGRVVFIIVYHPHHAAYTAGAVIDHLHHTFIIIIIDHLHHTTRTVVNYMLHHATCIVIYIIILDHTTSIIILISNMHHTTLKDTLIFLRKWIVRIIDFYLLSWHLIRYK